MEKILAMSKPNKGLTLRYRRNPNKSAGRNRKSNNNKNDL